MKVDLQIKPFPTLPNDEPGHVRNMTKSLPFFQGKPGSYVHRIRSGHLFFRKGEFSHSAVSFWCGGNGFPNHSKGSRRHNGQMLGEPPAGSVLCATCEGRAVGSGLLGAPIICGRPVRFAPRMTRDAKVLQKRTKKILEPIA